MNRKPTIRSAADDLVWSDEEDCDEKYLVKQSEAYLDDDSLDSFQINENKDHMESSIIGVDRLADHRRSKFSGSVQVDKLHRIALAREAKATAQEQPFHPPVTSFVKQTLGSEQLSMIWAAFVEFGADESEMILVKDARRISEHLGLPDLPIAQIALLRGMERSDYIDFSTLVAEAAKLYKPLERYVSSKPSTDFCKLCCALTACVHLVPNNARSAATPRGTSRAVVGSSGSEAGDDDDGGDPLPQFHFVGSEEHRMNIVFSEIKHELNGKVRIRHIAQLMEKLLIPFDKKRLPQKFWTNRGDLLIASVDELSDLVAQLRTDLEKEVDPMACMFKYELPQWLREEFKASEIMLYEHHFALIDKDGGGSIDVDELQALVTAFGSKISREDAQNMLDEYDMDGGGTIDFVEFMVLIYKIQRGTIDLSSSDLAQALVEAKSQLKIFEEIEEVSRHPPACCSVAHFGGSPVECNFHILGPPGSPYEGLKMTLQMTFHDGYPYRQPDIMFCGRVMGLHVLPALGGDARLMHIKQVWNAEWSMHRLLVHVVDILSAPDPELLPDNLYEIYASWEAALKGLQSKLRDTAERQLRSEHQAESKASDAAAAEATELDGAIKAESDSQLAAGGKGASPRADAKVHGSAEAKSVDKKHGDEAADKRDSVAGSRRPSGMGESISEEDVAARLRTLEAGLAMDDLSDALTRRRVLALSRIERMHLSTMLMYLVDPKKYASTVSAFMLANFKPSDE